MLRRIRAVLPEAVGLLLWIGKQVFLFVFTFLRFQRSSDYASSKALLGPTLALAKASAAVINFNCLLLVLSMCQITITFLRQFKLLPFDKHRQLHRLASGSIVLFSLVHTIAHYINLSKIPTNWAHLAFLSGPGATGHVMWLLLGLVILTASIKAVRQLCFELYWYTHHLGFVFLAVAAFHGAFCFFQRDVGRSCSGPTTWKWIAGPLGLYAGEWVWREVRMRRFTYISKVIVHQPNVVEIQIKKPSLSFRAGQYVYLYCPQASWLQRHPFTLTSAPEEDHLSVHVRIVGKWTFRLATAFGVLFDEKACSVSKSRVLGYSPPPKLPMLLVDGPYGSVTESYDQFEVAVCIGAGIGQTPFASILKSMWYSLSHPYMTLKLKKVLYYGISRDLQSLSWFLDVLKALEKENHDGLLELNCYMTGKLSPEQSLYLHMTQASGHRVDPITGLGTATRFGRPNFQALFHKWRTDFAAFRTIGVFYCGPKELGRQLHLLCDANSKSGLNFSFNEENF